MRLKLAQTEDIMLLSNLNAASWRVAYQNIIPQQFLDELPDDFWVEAFHRWFVQNSVEAHIIYDGDFAVGCVSYGKSRDEKYPDWGEVLSIYLLPEYFGKGFGKELMNSAVSQLRKRGYQNIYLWVFKDNDRARKFYEHYGFVPTEEYEYVTLLGKELTEVRYKLPASISPK